MTNKKFILFKNVIKKNRLNFITDKYFCMKSNFSFFINNIEYDNVFYQSHANEIKQNKMTRNTVNIRHLTILVKNLYMITS